MHAKQLKHSMKVMFCTSVTKILYILMLFSTLSWAHNHACTIKPYLWFRGAAELTWNILLDILFLYCDINMPGFICVISKIAF